MIIFLNFRLGRASDERVFPITPPGDPRRPEYLPGADKPIPPCKGGLLCNVEGCSANCARKYLKIVITPDPFMGLSSETAGSFTSVIPTDDKYQRRRSRPPSARSAGEGGRGG